MTIDASRSETGSARIRLGMVGGGRGAFIGAVTFSGSVIAFGKLSGKYKFRLFQGAPVNFAGQHMLNLVLGLALIGLIGVFMATQRMDVFVALIALSFVLGVLILGESAHPMRIGAAVLIVSGLVLMKLSDG